MPLSSVEEGDLVNTSSIYMSTHTGTHVDAPRHMYSKGKSLDNLPLEILLGSVKVIELNVTKVINKEQLINYNLQGVKRLLVKTRNSQILNNNKFVDNYVYFSLEAAQYLVECGCKLVGIDYLSVDPPGDKLPAHEVLLSADVIIVEGLDLSQVPEGAYQLICLPLKIADCDGAPARVILQEI